MELHVIIFSLFISATVFLLFRHRRRHSSTLPPGNYGLPLIGETLHLISAYKSPNPEPFIDTRVARFGPVFTTHVFGEATVFSADPEVNRFVLQNEGKLFECSYPGSISNLLGKHSLLLMKGGLHKRMHSLTMSFANSAIIRDHLLNDIDRLIRFYLDSWTSRVFLMDEAKKITFALTMKQLMSYDPCEWTESLRKEYILVIEGFFTIPFPFFSTTYNRAIKARTKVADALSKVVQERRSANEKGEKKNDMLGALLDEEAAGGRQFSDEEIVDFLVALLVAGYETTSTIMTLAVKFLTDTPLALAQLKITFALTMKQLMSYDPCEWTESLRKEYILVIEGFFTIPFPFFSTTYNRAIKARTKVADALSKVVQERRSANEKGEKKNDMLGALLDEEAAGGRQFSDEEIVDFLVALLVAGYETTSTIMTLAVKFLTDTPLALAQLKEEQENIKAKKGESEALVWSDYKSMPFTQCVVNETLRVANIIGGIFRRTTSDVNIKGYTIPKGWKVFASFRAVHMNDEHFKDARSFNPWRWQSKTGAACPPCAFSPFGGGPRLCPGYELARVTLSVFLHHIVTKFSWEPAEEDRLVFFPTTRTLKQYPINVQRRNAAT